MAATPSPRARSSSRRPCSSTSCALQYGHQSAERWNSKIAPFGPKTESSVRSRPFWSDKLKVGTCSPTCGPSSATLMGVLDCIAREGRPTIATVSAVNIAIRISVCLIVRHATTTIRRCELGQSSSDRASTITCPSFSKSWVTVSMIGRQQT